MCLYFIPMNDTIFRPSMYEQVSRDCVIQLICCLAASLKFDSFEIFVVAVDEVGFNSNRQFSSSANVVVDINYLILSWYLANVRPVFNLLLSTDFSSNFQFCVWKLFLFDLVDTFSFFLFNLVDMNRRCTRSRGNRWNGQVWELTRAPPRPELTVTIAESGNCWYYKNSLDWGDEVC